MHRQISNHNESSRENGESDDIRPQAAVIKSERAENGCARDFDIQAVFVVDQGEVLDFIDDETFKPIVENGKLQNISRGCWKRDEGFGRTV